MTEAVNNHNEWGNPDLERQMSHASFTYMCLNWNSHENQETHEGPKGILLREGRVNVGNRGRNGEWWSKKY